MTGEKNTWPVEEKVEEAEEEEETEEVGSYWDWLPLELQARIIDIRDQPRRAYRRAVFRAEIAHNLLRHYRMACDVSDFARGWTTHPYRNLPSAGASRNGRPTETELSERFAVYLQLAKPEGADVERRTRCHFEECCSDHPEVAWWSVTRRKIRFGNQADDGGCVCIECHEQAVNLTHAHGLTAEDAMLMAEEQMAEDAMLMAEEHLDVMALLQRACGKEVVVGTMLSGTVRSLVSFGVFVTLFERPHGRRVDGLMHKSQLRLGADGHPEVGDKIDVYVVRLDPEHGRIGLSTHPPPRRFTATSASAPPTAPPTPARATEAFPNLPRLEDVPLAQEGAVTAQDELPQDKQMPLASAVAGLAVLTRAPPERVLFQRTFRRLPKNGSMSPMRTLSLVHMRWRDEPFGE